MISLNETLFPAIIIPLSVTLTALVGFAALRLVGLLKTKKGANGDSAQPFVDDYLCNSPFRARMFKCLKRRDRKRGGGQRNKEHECGNPSDDTLSSVLVPPLPFRRRRHIASKTAPPSHQKMETATATSNSSSFHIFSSLLDLSRMQQWQLILQQCNGCNHRQMRRQAKKVDADGLYPLHWACSGGAPVDVVRVLLRAYSKAVRRVDSQGSTALHFACHYGTSVQVAELLLQAYPRAAHKVDRLGRTALLHAVHKGGNLDLLQTMVKANPQSVMMQLPTTGHTPLYVAWAAVLRDHQGNRFGTRGVVGSKKWEKAVFLLSVASDGIQEQKKKNRQNLLLSAIKLFPRLPKGALELVVRACPEQSKKRDPVTGQFPLALAASVIPRECSNAVLEVLLETYPQASKALDTKGRSALALAISSGKLWEEGVERLLMAAPDGLFLVCRSERERLPPVALAAIRKQGVQCSKSTVATAVPTRSPAAFSPVSKGMQKGLQLKDKFHRIIAEQNEADGSHPGPQAIHLSTVYQLLRHDPSMLKNCSTTKC